MVAPRMKSEERREQADIAHRMATQILARIHDDFQREDWTHGNTEIDALRSEMIVRAAYRMIAIERERIATIRARVAWARENGINE